MYKGLTVLAMSGILVSAACTTADQDRAKREADHANEKATQALHEADREAKRLGAEAKTEAKALGNQIDRSLDGSASPSGADSPDQKLSRAKEKVRSAGEVAATKLDRAGLIARVKSKLASDVGLSTISGVDVDVTAHVITLTGVVASQDQERAAQDAVLKVDGVTKVINHLRVAP